MTAIQGIVVVVCGIIIALAIFLLVRSLRKMAKGRCCEGCAGCSQKEHCSSRLDIRERKGESGDGE